MTEEKEIALSLAKTLEQLQPGFVDLKRNRTTAGVVIGVFGFILALAGVPFSAAVSVFGFLMAVAGVTVTLYYRSKHLDYKVKSIERLYYPLCVVPYAGDSSIMFDGRANAQEVKFQSYELNLDGVMQALAPLSRRNVAPRILSYAEIVGDRPASEHQMLQHLNRIKGMSSAQSESSLSIRAFRNDDPITEVLSKFGSWTSKSLDDQSSKIISNLSKQTTSIRGIHAKVETVSFARQIREELARRHEEITAPLNNSMQVLQAYGKTVQQLMVSTLHQFNCPECGEGVVNQGNAYVCSKHGEVSLPLSFEADSFGRSFNLLEGEVKATVDDIRRRAEEKVLEARHRAAREEAEISSKFLPPEVEIKTRIIEFEKERAVARRVLGEQR